MSPFLAAFAIIPALLSAQAKTSAVSLDARGQDVREVLATLFAQTKKPYALDASIKGSLYLKLDGMAYEKALGIVLSQAGLFSKEQDGVIMISAKPYAAVKPVAESKPAVEKKPVVEKKVTVVAVKPTPAPVVKKPAIVVEVKKPTAVPSSDTILARKVTTHLSKAPLTMVFASLSKQAGTSIVVDASVPAYRIDANFANMSLRAALHEVCAAAGLEIQTGEGKIRIYKKTA